VSELALRDRVQMHGSKGGAGPFVTTASHLHDQMLLVKRRIQNEEVIKDIELTAAD
jgi:hypothetical protein